MCSAFINIIFAIWIHKHLVTVWPNKISTGNGFLIFKIWFLTMYTVCFFFLSFFLPSLSPFFFLPFSMSLSFFNLLSHLKILLNRFSCSKLNLICRSKVQAYSSFEGLGGGYHCNVHVYPQVELNILTVHANRKSMKQLNQLHMYGNLPQLYLPSNGENIIN